MAQTQDDTLEARLIAVESLVRQLRTDPAGTSTSLNDTSVLNPAAGAGWVSDGQYVDVLVTTGRLRVEPSASLLAPVNVTAYYGYQLDGPAPTAGAGTGIDGGPLPVAAAPDDVRAVAVSGAGATATKVCYHSGLAAGWYRVSGRMERLGLTTGTVNVGNRQLSATPV